MSFDGVPYDLAWLAWPLGIGLSVLVCGWCIGWVSFDAIKELLMNSVGCFLVSLRLVLFPCPCCHRSDPEDLYDGSDLGVQLEPSPLAQGTIPGERRNAAPMPPEDFQKKMPQPERLDLLGKLQCCGLYDPEAPLCSTVRKLFHGDGWEVEWLRAHEFMPGTPTLFGGEDGEPSPMDIEQGQCGDCYFLSSMAALAEDPNNIRRLFLQDEATEDGIYCVQLMKNGVWHEVWVDDVFPVLDGKAVYCKSKGTCKLWPMLIEKAFAILYGGGDYDKVGDGGFPAVALHTLSGCPTNQYDMRQHSREELWEALQVLQKPGAAAATAFVGKKPFGPYILPPQFRNCLISMREKMRCHRWTELLYVVGVMCLQVVKGCCCLPLQTCRLLSLIQEKCVGKQGCSGIVDGHAYSVLGVMEVNGHCGPERIVKLRNPYGDSEWRGRYSDRSTGSCGAWTEEAMEEARLEEAEDGAFWMEFSDFEAYFTCAALAYLRPGTDAEVDPELRESGWETVAETNKWHMNAFLLDLEATGKSPVFRCSCRLTVASFCRARITVDEFRNVKPKPQESDSEDSEPPDADDDRSSGMVSDHNWCLLVFDRASKELVENGHNKMGFRWLDHEFKASSDGGPFSECASLSTLEMSLEPGEYSVVITWSPSSSEDALPKKVSCIVAASAPGCLLASSDSDMASNASETRKESSPLLKS